jgi:hypothetical protein
VSWLPLYGLALFGFRLVAHVKLALEKTTNMSTVASFAWQWNSYAVLLEKKRNSTAMSKKLE